MHTPTNWQNYPTTTTPITAAQLNRIDGDASTAYNSAFTMTGRSYNGSISDTWANIVQNGGLVLTGYNTAADGLIVTYTRSGNTEIVPATDYIIDNVVGIGNVLKFPAVTFETTDTITAVIYKPTAIKPIVICTQVEYDAMQTHDSGTIYVIIPGVTT